VRNRALLALEYPATQDFYVASLWWRRLFSELFGTFLLVLVAARRGRRGDESRCGQSARPPSPLRASWSWRSSSSWAPSPVRI